MASDPYNIAGRSASPAAITFARQSSSLSSQRDVQSPTLGVTDLLRDRKNLLVLVSLAVDNFTVLCCYTMLAPFFPLEANKKGVSVTLVGLIFAVFPLVVVLCSPIVGVIIPVLGPKFTLITGLFIEGCSQIIFGFLDKMPNKITFVVFCFIVRCTTGIGSSMSGTANLTIVAQTFGKNMAVAFGVLETFLGLGVMAGPTLGGFLYEAGGFRLPFFVLGCLVLVTDTVVFFILPQDSRDEGPSTTGSLLAALKIPAVSFIAAVVLCAGITISYLDPTLSHHLAKFHLSSGQVGLMFLLMTGMYALCAPVLGVLSAKLDTRIMMTVGCLLCAVAYLFLGPSPIFASALPSSLWLNGVSLAICGVGLALLFIPAITDMNKSAVAGGMPDDLGTHGVISGIFNALFNVGSVLGPTAAGAFSQYFGFPWAATIIAFVDLMTGFLLLVFSLCERRKWKENALDEERRPLVEKT